MPRRRYLASAHQFSPFGSTKHGMDGLWSERERTAEITQGDAGLGGDTVDADDTHEASDEKSSRDLQLCTPFHLEPLEHEHGHAHGDDVGDGVKTAHDLELAVQLDAGGFDVRSPCTLDGMALEEDDEELNEAVGADEAADGPESDAEFLAVAEDTVVEDEGGDLDGGCPGGVEFLHRECDLRGICVSCVER